MKFITKGLVLRQVKYKEFDKIVTLLTPDLGVVSVSAKGSLNPKNKLFSACELFSYSEWCLFENKARYNADDASVIEVFFGLRENIESVALATYMAEFMQIISPMGKEAKEILKLALNCMYVLAQKKATPKLVKAVFEMRIMTENGFMPNLVACEDCQKYAEDVFYFDINKGSLLCGECAKKMNILPNLDEASLSALRHIVFCEPKKLFNFEISQKSLKYLTIATENYSLFHLGCAPKSFEFLKSVL